MAIRIQPKGSAELYAGLGQRVAESRQAKDAADRMVDIHRINTQRDLAIMQNQMQLEKLRMAEMWELEKMQIASRNDFEREERKRQQQLDEYDSQIKAIETSDIFTDKEKEFLKIQVKTKIPVFQTLAKQMPSASVRNALGYLATSEDFVDRAGAINAAATKLGVDFATRYPEAVDIINQREQNDYAPISMMPEQQAAAPETPTTTKGISDTLKYLYYIPNFFSKNTPSQFLRGANWYKKTQNISETPNVFISPNASRRDKLLMYQQLGGSSTQEGRDFADKYLK